MNESDGDVCSGQSGSFAVFSANRDRGPVQVCRSDKAVSGIPAASPTAGAGAGSTAVRAATTAAAGGRAAAASGSVLTSGGSGSSGGCEVWAGALQHTQQLGTHLGTAALDVPPCL